MKYHECDLSDHDPHGDTMIVWTWYRRESLWRCHDCIVTRY